MALIGRSWPTRLGTLALAVGVIAWGAALIGALMVRNEWGGSKLAGFGLVPMGAAGAVAAAVLAVIAIIWCLAARKGNKGRAIVALIGSLVFLGWLGSEIAEGRDYPPIHDVTTDLADPPAFVLLPLDEDNLRGLDGEDQWRTLHAEAYGDIGPIRVGSPPAEVIREAARLAQERGWEIAGADPANGRLEATDTVSFYRFHDDVVLTARAVDGGGSRVDMRSVSRVGVSDLGYNAKRVRSFLAELEAALAP